MPSNTFSCRQSSSTLGLGFRLASSSCSNLKMDVRRFIAFGFMCPDESRSTSCSWSLVRVLLRRDGAAVQQTGAGAGGGHQTRSRIMNTAIEGRGGLPALLRWRRCRAISLGCPASTSMIQPSLSIPFFSSRLSQGSPGAFVQGLSGQSVPYCTVLNADTVQYSTVTVLA